MTKSHIYIFINNHISIIIFIVMDLYGITSLPAEEWNFQTGNDVFFTIKSDSRNISNFYI